MTIATWFILMTHKYRRAAEILKEVKAFVEEGVGIHVIVKGLRMARDLVSSSS